MPQYAWLAVLVGRGAGARAARALGAQRLRGSTASPPGRRWRSSRWSSWSPTCGTACTRRWRRSGSSAACKLERVLRPRTRRSTSAATAGIVQRTCTVGEAEHEEEQSKAPTSEARWTSRRQAQHQGCAARRTPPAQQPLAGKLTQAAQLQRARLRQERDGADRPRPAALGVEARWRSSYSGPVQRRPAAVARGCIGPTANLAARASCACCCSRCSLLCVLGFPGGVLAGVVAA